MRHRAKTRKRSPGWIGTRVTVCGQPILTDEADLICLLPPGHEPTNIHASMALSDQPILCIQDDEKEEIRWLSRDA